MTTSKITRKFERLLFKGIPEQPEHNWERNENSNVALRVTGRPPSSSANNCSSRIVTGESVGYFLYDDDKQTEEFIPES